MKFIISFSISFLLFFSYSTTSMAQSTINDVDVKPSLVKHQIKVKGASCKTDLGIIIGNVEKIAGVKNCELIKRGATSSLEVEYYADRVDVETIKSTIENTGTCEDPNARRYKVKL